MQDNEKLIQFRTAVGLVIKELRVKKDNVSITQLALEYDFDKSNLSKTERGLTNIYLATAWKISESLGVKLSTFAKLLEEKLGDDFKLMDE